jgi:hypothetical protein
MKSRYLPIFLLSFLAINPGAYAKSTCVTAKCLAQTKKKPLTEDTPIAQIDTGLRDPFQRPERRILTSLSSPNGPKEQIVSVSPHSSNF